jgi:hypothetical protein
MIALSRFAAVLLVAACIGCQSQSVQAEAQTGDTAAQPEPVQDNRQDKGDEMIDAVDLAQHQWKHRVILLFAPSSEQPDYQAMRKALAEQSDAVDERDLVVYHLYFDDSGSVGDQRLAPEAATALAENYDAPTDGFTYILVGKDGGEKMRADEAVAVEEIFARIDSMPMRQREMRE